MATEAVLAATLWSLAVGALLLVPSLWWLYRTFQQEERPDPSGAMMERRPRDLA
jgi:cytochrome d ubiquinol oxidase subunit II